MLKTELHVRIAFGILVLVTMVFVKKIVLMDAGIAGIPGARARDIVEIESELELKDLTHIGRDHRKNCRNNLLSNVPVLLWSTQVVLTQDAHNMLQNLL